MKRILFELEYIQNEANIIISTLIALGVIHGPANALIRADFVKELSEYASNQDRDDCYETDLSESVQLYITIDMKDVKTDGEILSLVPYIASIHAEDCSGEDEDTFDVSGLSKKLSKAIGVPAP